VRSGDAEALMVVLTDSNTVNRYISVGVNSLSLTNSCNAMYRSVYPTGGWESNLPRFLKWGVDGMVISIAFSTNFLCWDRQCQMWGLISHP